MTQEGMENAGRNILRLSLDHLNIPAGSRPADPAAVNAIKDSFRLIGQKTPISVCPDASQSDMYVLIAGHKRFLAAQALEWEYIEAVAEDHDEANQALWRIDENYARQELTTQERAECDAVRVKLLDSFPRQVDQKAGRGRPRGGVADAARNLEMPGKSEHAKRKQLERSAKIAAIAEAAKKAARDAGLDDNQSALLSIAREKGAEAQLAKVEELAKRRSERAAKNDPGHDGLPIAASPPLQPATSVGVPPDLAVLTLRPEDVSRLAKTYADEGELERILAPAVHQLAESAAVVVVTSVADIAAITGKLLGPICGFVKRPRIFRASHSAAFEITDEQVLVVVTRGRIKPRAIQESDLPGVATTEAILDLAAKMFPDAGTKAWLFADADLAGWSCSSPANCWIFEK